MKDRLKEKRPFSKGARMHQRDREFVRQLHEEIDEWEQEQLLSPQQLERLRARYPLKEETAAASTLVSIRWILYLAVFAFLAAFFSFAGSQSTQLGPPLRIGILLLSSVCCLLAGTWLQSRIRSESMALLILGGLLLPTTYYYAVYVYKLLTVSAPYLWLSALAAILAAIYIALGARLKEEGLLAVGFSCLLGLPFLWLAHFALQGLYHALTAALLALAVYALQTTQPQQPLLRPLWWLAQGLLIIALSVPIATRQYNTYFASLVYGLSTLFAFLQIRQSHSPYIQAPFLAALLMAVGSILQASHVPLLYFPLVQLGVTIGVVFFAHLALHQRQQLEALLTIYLVIIYGSTAGLWILRATNTGKTTWTLTMLAYLISGVGLYLFTYTRQSGRLQTSFLAAWHLLAALYMFLGKPPWTTEWMSIPTGVLFAINALFFADDEQEHRYLHLAVLILIVPSLIESFYDKHLLRTISLALGSIGMIAWGAMQKRHYLLLSGVVALIVSIFAKLFHQLSQLGIPRFIWFAIFGILLAGLAWFLQWTLRKEQEHTTLPTHTETER